jgi:hypothetical protein
MTINHEQQNSLVPDLFERDFYAIRHHKNWIPVRYEGKQSDGGYLFIGLVPNPGIIVSTFEEVKKRGIRQLSPDEKRRFVDLEAQFWTALHGFNDASQHWLNEQRRIQAAEVALCQQKGRVISWPKGRRKKGGR